MKLNIVTPEKKIFEDEVDSVSLPTLQGEITILPHHVPLMTQIKPGELTIRHKDKSEHLVTGGGFVEITGNRVSVLTDLAESSDQISLEKAEEAKKRAEEAIANKHNLTDEEVAVAMANLEKALASLNIKRRRHSRTP
jgi:F-type H+-transporting ATPase subunit epsilon